MIAYIIITISIIVWYFYRKKNFSDKKYQKLEVQKLYIVLLALIVVGFFLRLDYSEMIGDIYFDEPIFEIRNIIFSSFSFFIILLSWKSNSLKTKRNLFFIEFSVWLLKLLFFKGGYTMGFTPTVGYPVGLIVVFDFLSLLTRLWIGTKLLDIKTRIFNIGIIAFVFISFKIFIPIQLCFNLNDLLNTKKAQETHELMIGNWKGSLIQNVINFDTVQPVKNALDSNSLIAILNQDKPEIIEKQKTISIDIRLKIDSNTIIFKPNLFITDTLLLEMYSKTYGTIYDTTNLNMTSYEIYIESITPDSLKFEIQDMIKPIYILKLKKTTS